MGVCVRIHAALRRVGKANGSRERAPDDKLRVPTKPQHAKVVGMAQARLCPPYGFPLPYFAGSSSET
jgi:hypothetical protein